MPCVRRNWMPPSSSRWTSSVIWRTYFTAILIPDKEVNVSCRKSGIIGAVLRHFPNVSQIPSFCRRLWGISCRGAAELRDGRHALDRADPMSPVRGKAAIMERSAPQPVAPLAPGLRSRCQCPSVFISMTWRWGPNRSCNCYSTRDGLFLAARFQQVL